MPCDSGTEGTPCRIVFPARPPQLPTLRMLAVSGVNRDVTTDRTESGSRIRGWPTRILVGGVAIFSALLVSLALGHRTPRQTAACDGWLSEDFLAAVDAETVAACLKSGADVTARDGLLNTPLHFVAARNADPA